MAKTIKQALKDAQLSFESVSDSARLDAECLLSFVLAKPSTYLRTWPEQDLFDEDLAKFLSLVRRREQGEPIAYILETKEFWSLELNVTKDTLIPRPETETLVEQALLISRKQTVKSILDLGTGTGAIAIALATELSNQQSTPHIIATDLSESVLKITRQNVSKHFADVKLIQSDWFSALEQQQFDLIVSNPPYIEQDDEHLKQGDVRFEPLSALASGDDGLDAIRHIIEQAKKWLNPAGWLLLEHGYNQAGEVQQLLSQSGYSKVQTVKDLANQDRVSCGCNS